MLIDGGYESLKSQVGGYIEFVYMDDGCALIVNEEGKLLDLPFNRFLRRKNGTAVDMIVGDFLVVGIDGEDVRGLTDDEVEKYYIIYEEAWK